MKYQHQHPLRFQGSMLIHSMVVDGNVVSFVCQALVHVHEGEEICNEGQAGIFF